MSDFPYFHKAARRDIMGEHIYANAKLTGI